MRMIRDVTQMQMEKHLFFWSHQNKGNRKNWFVDKMPEITWPNRCTTLTNDNWMKTDLPSYTRYGFIAFWNGCSKSEREREIFRERNLSLNTFSLFSLSLERVERLYWLGHTIRNCKHEGEWEHFKALAMTTESFWIFSIDKRGVPRICAQASMISLQFPLKCETTMWFCYNLCNGYGTSYPKAQRKQFSLLYNRASDEDVSQLIGIVLDTFNILQVIRAQQTFFSRLSLFWQI